MNLVLPYLNGGSFEVTLTYSLKRLFFILFSGIRARFGSKVDFITVYIEEAHPSNKDHFRGHIEIETHQNLQVMINKKTLEKEDSSYDHK